MRGKLVASLIVVVLFFVMLSGCTSSNTSNNTATPSGTIATASPIITGADFLGTWSGKGVANYTYTFNENGSFILYVNGELFGTYPAGSWTKVDNLHYKVVGTILQGVAVMNNKTSWYFEESPTVMFIKQ